MQRPSVNIKPPETQEEIQKRIASYEDATSRIEVILGGYSESECVGILRFVTKKAEIELKKMLDAEMASMNDLLCETEIINKLKKGESNVKKR